MALKTKVKVGNITSLSEARYCAGMGVDFLGFPLLDIESDVKRFKEITSWIAGAATIIECADSVDITSIDKNDQPWDFIQLPVESIDFIDLGEITKPIFIRLPGRITESLLTEIKKKSSIHYLIVSRQGWNTSRQLLSSFKVFVTIDSETNVEELLAQGVYGISLSGSEESKPGIQDYAALADILEALEVNED